MPAHDLDLSTFPPAILEAALVASRERVTREKEEIEKEIQKHEKAMLKNETEMLKHKKEMQKSETEMLKLLKRFDEVEEGEGAPGSERNVAGGSQRKAKRPRGDSSSEDEEDERYSRWSIAKVRKMDPGLIPPLRYVCSKDEVPHNNRTHSPSCTRCRKKGVRCERDGNSTSRSRRCLACQRSKQGCDLNRPDTASSRN